MAKVKLRYKDAKRDDRFHEALDTVWAKIWPHTWVVGIALGVLLLAVVAYIIINRRIVMGRDVPWDKRFQIRYEAEKAQRYFGVGEDGKLPPEALEAEEKQFERMRALIEEYPGHPVAAVLLLELSFQRLSAGERERLLEPKASQAHFKRAAEAAEEFVAQFANHDLVTVASYNAGRARLEIGQYERAARHFQMAEGTGFPFLAALAKLLRARCYEELGRLDEARTLYEELSRDTMASWCAQQAEFHLTQIDRRPRKGS